jgi:hypothetical protein
MSMSLRFQPKPHRLGKEAGAVRLGNRYSFDHGPFVEPGTCEYHESLRITRQRDIVSVAVWRTNIAPLGTLPGLRSRIAPR